MTTERFVSTSGTISIDTGDSVVVGVSTLFGSRDREGAQVWVQPTDAAPYRIGTVAAVDPRGVYDHFELPLVSAWNGAPVVAAQYELIDGLALASSAGVTAVFARFTAYLENNFGLVGNLADMLSDDAWSRVFNDTLFVDAVTRTIWQYRNGVLEPVYVIGTAFTPRGLYSAATTYAANDLVETGGGIFVSNAAGNLNHAPTVSPSFASDTYWTWLPLPAAGDFFDLAINAFSTLGATETIGRHTFTGTVVFPAGLTLSRATAGIAPTDSAVITLKRNGVTFGTVTFDVAEDIAVLAAASDTTFTAGDVLTAIAPDNADDTLADVAITLRGTRSGGALTQHGVAVLDYGAFPGEGFASVTLTGIPRIANDSVVQAWLFPGEGTDDHSADEHKVASMRITVSDVVEGVGFTINGFCDEPSAGARHYGEWNVAWRWE